MGMSQENLQLGNELRNALLRSVASDGYQVFAVDLPSDKKGDLILDQVDRVYADAILYCFIVGANYSDSLYGDGGAFRPSVKVVAELIDTKSKAILLERFYDYDAYEASAPVTITTPNSGENIAVASGSAMTAALSVLQPSTKYAFDSIDAIFENLPAAADGLRASAPLIAHEIATAIARPSPS